MSSNPSLTGTGQAFIEALAGRDFDRLEKLFSPNVRRHLTRVLKEYVRYYNELRPHQEIKQKVPVVPAQSAPVAGKIISFPVLNGLHQVYQIAV